MAKIRNKYTKDLLAEAARNSYSVAEVMRKLNIQPAGGTHAHIKKRLMDFGIDTSHFLGQGWNIHGRQTGGPIKRIAQQILILRPSHSPLEKTRFLRRALLEVGREYKCAMCGSEAIWNDRPLVLEIDHINSLRYDNRVENLRFLCPNCHSQTSGYNKRSRK